MDYNKRIRNYKKQQELKETILSLKDKVLEKIDKTKEVCKESTESTLKKTFREGIYSVVIEAVKGLIVKNATEEIYVTKISKKEMDDAVSIKEVVTSVSEDFAKHLTSEYTDILYKVIFAYFKDEEQLTVSKTKDCITIELEVPKVEEPEDDFDEELDEDLKPVE